jgi:hypothetical protein
MSLTVGGQCSPPEDQEAINELIGILMERPELGRVIGEYIASHETISRARDVLEAVKEAMQ